MKAIVWLKPDLTIAITNPVGSPGSGESEDQFLDRVAAKGVADGAIPGDWVRQPNVDAVDIPADRTFRNAWTWDGSNIVTDLVKAKAILTKKARRKYDDRFKDLHVELVKAEGDQAAVDAAEADLAAFRNAARTKLNLIRDAATLQDLRAINL
mgnify:CR=1 FL=1